MVNTGEALVSVLQMLSLRDEEKGVDIKKDKNTKKTKGVIKDDEKDDSSLNSKQSRIVRQIATIFGEVLEVGSFKKGPEATRLTQKQPKEKLGSSITTIAPPPEKKEGLGLDKLLMVTGAAAVIGAAAALFNELGAVGRALTKFGFKLAPTVFKLLTKGVSATLDGLMSSLKAIKGIKSFKLAKYMEANFPKTLKAIDSIKDFFRSVGRLTRVMLGFDVAKDAVKIGDNVKDIAKIGDTVKDTIKLSEGLKDIAKLSDIVKDGIKIGDNVKDIAKIGDTVKDTIKLSEGLKDIAKLSDIVKDGIKIGDNVADATKIGDTVKDTIKLSEGLKDIAKLSDIVKDGIKIGDNVADATKILKAVPKLSFASALADTVVSGIKAVFTTLGAGVEIVKNMVKIPGGGIISVIGKAIKPWGLKLAKGLKFVPYIGAFFNIGFGIARISKGEIIPGIVEIIAGLVDFVPFAGNAISLVLDGALLMYDLQKERAQSGPPTINENSGFFDKLKYYVSEKIMPILRYVPVIGGMFYFGDALREFQAGQTGKGIELLGQGLIALIGGKGLVDGISALMSFINTEKSTEDVEIPKSAGFMESIISSVKKAVSEGRLMKTFSYLTDSWNSFKALNFIEGFSSLAKFYGSFFLAVSPIGMLIDLFTVDEKLNDSPDVDNNESLVNKIKEGISAAKDKLVKWLNSAVEWAKKSTERVINFFKGIIGDNSKTEFSDEDFIKSFPVMPGNESPRANQKDVSEYIKLGPKSPIKIPTTDKLKANDIWWDKVISTNISPTTDKLKANDNISPSNKQEVILNAKIDESETAKLLKRSTIADNIASKKVESQLVDQNKKSATQVELLVNISKGINELIGLMAPMQPTQKTFMETYNNIQTSQPTPYKQQPSSIQDIRTAFNQSTQPSVFSLLTK